MTGPLSATSTRLRAIRASTVNKQIFRALLSLASAALLIRVAGMLNQVVITSRFGVGPAMDAYFISSTWPLLLASLLGSAIEAAVIPAYTHIRTQGTKAEASRLFSTLLNLFIVSGVLVTLVMFLFRSQLILLSAPGSPSTVLGLASDLVPFTFPVFVLTVVIYYLECILNTEGQFGWPAYAGMLVPLTTAVFVLTIGHALGVVALSIGMIAGLLLQLCAFFIRARRAGLTYHFILEVRNPEIALIVKAGWPVLIGALIGQAINLIDQIFASFFAAGSISALNYALKLISVFTGVIFVSVGRAILPYLSRHASTNDMKSFKDTLRLYIWLVGIGTTVLSIFVIVLAHPIVQILFQRGAFTAADTNYTAIMFIGFAVGLTPIAFGFIAFRAFSALGKTRALLLVTLFSLLGNTVFDYVFSRLWQGVGIALSTSVSYVFSMFILFFLLRRLIGDLHIFTPPPEIVDFLRKIAIALGLVQRSSLTVGMLATYHSSASTRTGQSGSFSPFNIPFKMRQHLIRFGIMIGVFVIGVVGIFLNSLYALRISLASIILLVLIRYDFVLLIGWILINAPNTMPIFRGTNVLIGLTIPTFLVLTTLPITQTIKRFPALAFLGIYLLWASTSLTISPIGLGPALTAWVLELDCLTVSILAINVINTRRRLLLCIDTMLLVSACIALYGIYGYITRHNGAADPTTSLFRIVSIFAAPPGLAFFLSLMIPLALYRACTLQGFKRLVAGLTTIILLMAAMLTFTRSAFIYIPVSILFMAFFVPSRRMRNALLSSLSMLAALMILLTLIGIPILSRFASQDLGTLNGRTLIWQAILSHFDPTKLLGNGILASAALLATLNVGAIGTSPHALLLGTLYDHGIIGVILLVIVFIALASNLINGARKSSGDQRGLFAVALAVLVVVVLQSIDSNDFWDPALDIYIWIILVLPFVAYWTKQEPPADSQEPPTEADEDFDEEPTEKRLAVRLSAEQKQVISA